MAAPERPHPFRADQAGVFVNSTEKYLCSIYELEEEDGIAPKRAALTARLGLSRSAVNQRVARLIQDGLVTLTAQRRVQLTESGRPVAIRVLRKHRLAECLLVDVIGLEWEKAHAEASRWQHVLGEVVERKLVALLDDPMHSPFGNPVPGLADLSRSRKGVRRPPGPRRDLPGIRLYDLARTGGGEAQVCRIFERLQEDPRRLVELRAAGVLPSSTITVAPLERVGNRIRAVSATGDVVLHAVEAQSILVSRGGTG